MKDDMKYNPITGEMDLVAETQKKSYPVPCEALLGEIRQYTGTTDANFTHGYFYECVSDGQTPPTYSWQRSNVQPVGEGETTNFVEIGGNATDNTSLATALASKTVTIDGKAITLPAWVANHAYKVGNQVMVGTQYYRCSTAHTSGESFSAAAGWSEITDFTPHCGNLQVLTIGSTDHPIYVNLLKIDDFNTTSTGLAVGSVWYSLSSHCLRYKKSSGNVTIPYMDGVIYLYKDMLYYWDGADLVPYTDTWMSEITFRKSGFIKSSDGLLRSDASFKASDYIDMSLVKSIYITVANGVETTAMIAYYDSAKNFISSVANPGASVYVNDYKIERSNFPANTAYVRMSYHISNTRYKSRCEYSLGDIHYAIGSIKSSLLSISTDISSLSDKIDVLSNANKKKNSFIVVIPGDDSSFAYSNKFPLIQGKQYRIIFSNPTFQTYAQNNYKLGLYYIDGNNERQSQQRWGVVENIPQYYDFTAQSNIYQIGGRVSTTDMCAALIIPKDAFGITSQSTPTILDLNPESEFKPKFQSAKKRYYTSTVNDKPDPIVLMHISDIHANWTNVSRFLEFCSHYDDYIDMMVNTGDTVSDKFADGVDGYEDIDGVEDIINVIGNHDTATVVDGTRSWQTYAGTQDAYNRYYEHVSEWGVTQPSGIGENDYYPCYCYKDFSTQKLRVIFVDVMAYDATEDSWLDGVLDDAIANEYHVLIACHMAGFMPNSSDIPYTKVESNYSTLYSLATTAAQTNGYNEYAYHMIDTVDAFIAGGGVFVGYLCGHSHMDYVAKKGVDTKQWIYAIGSAASGEKRDYNHIANTRMQDEFQIVSIDTYSKTITLYKVGANVDKYGRHKNSICIDYNNHSVKCEGY